MFCGFAQSVQDNALKQVKYKPTYFLICYIHTCPPIMYCTIYIVEQRLMKWERKKERSKERKKTHTHTYTYTYTVATWNQSNRAGSV